MKRINQAKRGLPLIYETLYFFYSSTLPRRIIIKRGIHLGIAGSLETNRSDRDGSTLRALFFFSDIPFPDVGCVISRAPVSTVRNDPGQADTLGFFKLEIAFLALIFDPGRYFTEKYEASSQFSTLAHQWMKLKRDTFAPTIIDQP